MQDNDLNTLLKSVINEIEEVIRVEIENHGYSSQANSLKILEELLREQIKHEDTRTSTVTQR